MSSVAKSSSTRATRSAASKSPVKDSANVVTPRKRNQQQNQSKTDARKKRAVNNKYFFFNMGDNAKDAFFESPHLAAKHRRDYEGLIVQEKGFSNKKDFLSFKKDHLNPLLNPKSPQVAPPPDSNEAALPDPIVSLMNNDKDCDRIEAHWKVTSSSDKCVIIIRFISQYGTDSWVWKPDMKCEVLNKWADVMEINDELLFEAFSNMTSGKASDPDNSDKNVPLVTIYNPPNDPKKSIQLNVERAYTFFTIPHESLKNEKAEMEWLKSTIPRILRGLRDTLNTPLFKATMERLGQGRRQGHINKLYNPSQKSNLPKFLNGCLVKCEPVRMLTDHVIQVVSNDIMTHLWQHKTSEPKCADEEEVTEEDVDETEDLQNIPNEDMPTQEDSDEEGDDDDEEDNDENN